MQMDPEAISVCNPTDLESILIDESAEPRNLRVSLLESITDNFSDAMVIGSGGFAVVYKGRLQNNTVAVKKLTQSSNVDETKFQQEVDSLMSAKHNNIVRFLGYCSDTQGKVCKLNGKNIMAEERQRFLCFEYLPWSLDKYIKDPSRGHEWRTCYQIIKGICQGLHYLHQQNIVHLDLKPANILLDHGMVPKIADFGLSKRFDEKETHLVTSNLCGSLGYVAPEFFHGLITYKSDIYSLGIIIFETLTGNKGCPGIDSVLESWSVKLDTSPGDIQLEAVRVLAEIGIECTDFTPAKRPDTWRILERLDEIASIHDVINESSTVSAAPSPLQQITGILQGPGGTRRKILSGRSSKFSKLLDIHPLELRFPWKPNEDIKCPVTLTNRTDCYVGVWITPTCEDTGCDICFNDMDSWGPAPIYVDILEPHSTIVVVLKVKAQGETPPDATFEVLMGVARSKEECLKFWRIVTRRKLNMDGEFLKRVEEVGGEVHVAKLKAVICDPATSCQRSVIDQQEFIPAPWSECGYIDGIDLHPTETWILAHHRDGAVSIFNYETQKIEMVLQISRVVKNKKGSIFSPSTWKCTPRQNKTWKHMLSSASTGSSSHHPFYISSAKFIAQEQWFAAGDISGWVHVYSYTTKDKVIEFEAHRKHPDADKKGLGVLSLAIHPTSSYLLTSCRGDDAIKLWDWSKGWKCTRKFDNNSRGTSYVTWNPMDSDTFISIDDGHVIMVWNIHSPDHPITRLEGSGEAVSCCLYSDGHQNFMFTRGRLRSNHDCAHVWDLETSFTKKEDMETKEHVHKLSLKGYETTHIACHPTLPILVTGSSSDDLCVWDARTYRLAEMVHGQFPSIEGIVLTGTEHSTRLIVGCSGVISVMKINLPTLDTTDLQTHGRSQETPHNLGKAASAACRCIVSLGPTYNASLYSALHPELRDPGCSSASGRN